MGDIKKIKNLAEAFRSALESVPKYEFSSSLSFTEFPKGCCDDASLLLAAYFSDNSVTGAKRILGLKDGDQSIETHVWLKIDNILVDITADQFNENGYNLEKVIVTESSKFHDSFKVNHSKTELADFRIKFKNASNILSTFAGCYKTIIHAI